METDEATGISQRIIPHGCIQLVFYRNTPVILSLPFQQEQRYSRALLCGQTTRFFDLMPAGHLKMIAIVFHPFGAKAFFPIPMDKLADRVTAAEDLEIPALTDLVNRITDTEEDDLCIGHIEHFLWNALSPIKDYNYNRMLAAIREVNQSNGELRIAWLAESVCLSYKQFQRIFMEHIGINPKDFVRTVRFQQALYILQTRPDTPFSQLAHECGYYDQSHMVNEFKTFSGYTPSEYIGICPPYSDYFS